MFYTTHIHDLLDTAYGLVTMKTNAKLDSQARANNRKPRSLCVKDESEYARGTTIIKPD